MDLWIVPDTFYSYENIKCSRWYLTPEYCSTCHLHLIFFCLTYICGVSNEFCPGIRRSTMGGMCWGQKVSESPILSNFLVTIYWVTTTSKLYNIYVSSNTQYKKYVMIPSLFCKISSFLDKRRYCEMHIVVQKKTRGNPREKRVFAQEKREPCTP